MGSRILICHRFSMLFFFSVHIHGYGILMVLSNWRLG